MRRETCGQSMEPIQRIPTVVGSGIILPTVVLVYRLIAEEPGDVKPYVPVSVVGTGRHDHDPLRVRARRDL